MPAKPAPNKIPVALLQIQLMSSKSSSVNVGESPTISIDDCKPGLKLRRFIATNLVPYREEKDNW